MTTCAKPPFRTLLLAIGAVALLSGCPKPGGPSGSVAGTPGFTVHQVSLRDGGRAIALNGDVTYGTAKELARLIKQHPEIREVHLTSDGGLVHPALTVANAIQLRRATVFVPTKCISACTLLFLGGQERYIAPDAKLGFHRAFGDLDEPETANTLLTNERIRLRLIERDVSPDFAAQVLATPGSEVWYPTHAELLESGVVDAVLPESQLPP